MRPSGDPRPTPASVLAPALVLISAGLAAAQATPGDGPELSGPSGMPASVPSSPLPGPAPIPGPAPASASPPRRAVMAVPGLMGPGSAIGRPTITSTPLRPAIEAAGAPELDGPLEMPGAPPASRARAGVAGRPVLVEPIPFEEGPFDGPPAPRSAASTRRTSPLPESSDRPGPTPSPRRGRFFGLFPGQVAPSTPAPRAPAPGRAVVDDLRFEPSGESSLRARVERQAKVAVGDRARSIDVRIEGRSATVQARGVKFLQKRAVRKSLESLPALSGLRSTIEVLD